MAYHSKWIDMISACIHHFALYFPTSEPSFLWLSNVTKKHQATSVLVHGHIFALRLRRWICSIWVNGWNSIFYRRDKICPELHIMTCVKFQRNPFYFSTVNLQYHIKQKLALPIISFVSNASPLGIVSQRNMFTVSSQQD